MALCTTRSSARPPVNSGGLSFHVYRVGGIWGDDKIVTADDRRTLRYYLKGTRLAANWQLTLHTGSDTGTPVCHVKSPYLGPPMAPTDPGPIRITFGSGSARQSQTHPHPQGRVVYVHHETGVCDSVYTFRGFDDKEYRWRSSRTGWLANRMECLDSQDRVVAAFRITLFAIFKDGELRIHQPVQSMAELFIVTLLAIRTPDH